MIDKKQIEELRTQRFTYQQIADQLHVSKQRIYQIINNYKKTGRKGRKKYYKNMGKCELCKKNSAILLHHKDGNNSNDIAENLEKLCSICHITKHKKFDLTELKPLHAYIAIELYEKLRKLAFDTNRSMSDIVRELVHKEVTQWRP